VAQSGLAIFGMFEQFERGAGKRFRSRARVQRCQRRAMKAASRSFGHFDPLFTAISLSRRMQSEQPPD